MRDRRVRMAMESGRNTQADTAPEPAGAPDPAARLRAAAQVRQHAEALTRPDVQALAYWLRPADVGLDQLSEFVGAGFRRLAHDLAFAIETDTPALVGDEVAWLVHLLDARGYDPRQAVIALQMFEAALAVVCAPDVLALARPALVAGYQAAEHAVAALPPDAGRPAP